MRDACAVVLAGGQSKRFGSDKAFARLRGSPLLTHVLKGLSAAGFQQIGIAAKDPRAYAPLAEEVAYVSGQKIELLADAHPAATPLSGLAAALRASRHELVFACGGDMPYAADPALIDALTTAMEDHDAAVPESGGSLQPLCALWRKSTCRDRAEALLASPHSPGPRAILRTVRWARVPWKSERPFMDADTPEALLELERLP